MEKRNLIGLLPSDIYSWLETEGEPSFRAQQIFQWIYEKKADSFDKMNNLPLTLREKLDGTFSLGSSRVEEVQKSKDGTVKFLIRFPSLKVQWKQYLFPIWIIELFAFLLKWAVQWVALFVLLVLLGSGEILPTRR